MNINVTAHHVEITSALKEYAKKKMEKLLKFFDNIQHIDIHLKIEDNADESKRQIVEVNLKASKAHIRAEDKSGDMYSSIDMIYDKLESQLTKHKEKLRDNMHGTSKNRSYTTTNSNQKEDVLYIPKPMTAEDAATLYKDGQKFLMFRNSKTNDINVLYELEDGNLGLIEP